MSLSASRSNLKQIRVLLLAAAPIYTLFGLFLLHEYNGEKIDYLRLLPIFCLYVAFGGTLYLKRFENSDFLPQVFALIMATLVVANTLFQPLKYTHSSVYFLSIVIITTAVIDVSALLKKGAALLNICVVVAIFLAQAIRAESLHNVSIIGPLTAFLAWQIIMQLKITEIFGQVIDAKQFAAYRSTVVMLNHEFNNVNAVCLMLLEDVVDEESALKSPSPTQMKHLEKNIRRLSDLIQTVSNLSTFVEVDYIKNGSPMVKVKEED